MSTFDDDDLTPYERIERARYGEESESLPEAGERVLTLWHRILLGTFHGGDIGASLTTLARLLKLLSEADLLLTKLVGFHSISVGLCFNAELAAAVGEEIAAKMEGSTPQLEALRQIAEEWMAEHDSPATPPIVPHILYAAMLHWANGDEFTWGMYKRMMPRLFRIPLPELLTRLNLISASRVAESHALIDRIAKLPVSIRSSVFIRFENPETGMTSKDFGPYPWIEMIRDEIKTAPSGRHLATLQYLPDYDVSVWLVDDPSIAKGQFFTNVVIGPATPTKAGVVVEDPEPPAVAGE